MKLTDEEADDAVQFDENLRAVIKKFQTEMTAKYGEARSYHMFMQVWLERTVHAYWHKADRQLVLDVLAEQWSGGQPISNH